MQKWWLALLSRMMRSVSIWNSLLGGGPASPPLSDDAKKQPSWWWTHSKGHSAVSDIATQISCLYLLQCQIAATAETIVVHLLAILTGVNACHSKQLPVDYIHTVCIAPHTLQ